MKWHSDRSSTVLLTNRRGDSSSSDCDASRFRSTKTDDDDKADPPTLLGQKRSDSKSRNDLPASATFCAKVSFPGLLNMNRFHRGDVFGTAPGSTPNDESDHASKYPVDTDACLETFHDLARSSDAQR